jgi:putative ABC transport system permease protein
MVAIVSRSLAALLVPEGRPIGHRVGPAEIVGVVDDFRGVRNLEPLTIYRPLAQMPPRPVYPGSGGPRLIVRAAGDVGAAVAAVNAAVRGLDPQVHLRSINTIEAGVLDEMAPQRFGMAVMGALGGIALLLSVLGTWVLAESMATLRRREMGIRAALGASRHHLRTLLLSEALRLVGLGLLAGFGLSWLGAGTIRAFLFQVEPFDPVVTASVAAVILALTLAASLRPALASGRVDPARVLRED